MRFFFTRLSLDKDKEVAEMTALQAPLFQKKVVVSTKHYFIYFQVTETFCYVMLFVDNYQYPWLSP